MKIVVNKCYGGWGVSVEALKALYLMKSNAVKSTTIKEYYGRNSTKKWEKDKAEYLPIGDGIWAHKMDFNIWDEKTPNVLYDINNRSDEARTNNDLIELIENGKINVNGNYADLRVVEIPDNVEWEIDEYDGIESIHEKHRSW